jgi:hypothetical protein
MADNQQIQTARVALGSMGSSVDNDLANLEAALRTIFGATADSDISAISTIGAGPDMTLLGTLTLAGDPTTDLQACSKQYVDNASGGDAASVVAGAHLTSLQDITSGSTDVISWDAATFEDGGDSWAVGNPTRLTAPETGNYYVQGLFEMYTVGGSVEAKVAVKLNGSSWLYTHIGHAFTTQGGGQVIGVPIMFMEPLTAGDYLEFYVTAVGVNVRVDATSRVSWFKVGD